MQRHDAGSVAVLAVGFDIERFDTVETGAEINASPISYSVDGKQYVAIAADSAIFTFALP